MHRRDEDNNQQNAAVKVLVYEHRTFDKASLINIACSGIYKCERRSGHAKYKPEINKKTETQRLRWTCGPVISFHNGCGGKISMGEQIGE